MNAGYQRFNLVIKILLLVMLIIGGNLLSEWIAEQLDFELTPGTEPMIHRIIMASAAAYTILLAFPFVPGVEIGLALIAMFGLRILLLVYLCTLTGLSLSFIVGASIPEKFLFRFVRSLHLKKTSDLLEQLENLDTEQRLQMLLARAPARFIPALIHYRYL